MTFDKELNKKGLGELYYGKENLMGEISNAKVKKARYHVDLSEEMGKDLTEIADKMGLSLSAVVKLMLMQNWMKYRVNGFDYLYLGVADMPAKIGEIPY